MLLWFLNQPRPQLLSYTSNSLVTFVCFFSFFFYLIICVYPRRSEESDRSPEIRVTDDCLLPCSVLNHWSHLSSPLFITFIWKKWIKFSKCVGLVSLCSFSSFKFCLMFVRQSLAENTFMIGKSYCWISPFYSLCYLFSFHLKLSLALKWISLTIV